MSVDVLIADKHAAVRDALKRILDDTSDLIVAGEASDANTAIGMVRAREWGLIVLDLALQGRSGLDLIKQIKIARKTLPIFIYSMHAEDQYAVRAIRAGASGYLSKSDDSELLLPGLRKVASGGVYVNQRVAELFVSSHLPNVAALPHAQLTDREFDIFISLASGSSLTEIAELHSLSVKTVSSHKARILSKMQLADRSDLVRYAIHCGLAQPPK